MQPAEGDKRLGRSVHLVNLGAFLPLEAHAQLLDLSDVTVTLILRLLKQLALVLRCALQNANLQLKHQRLRWVAVAQPCLSVFKPLLQLINLIFLHPQSLLGASEALLAVAVLDEYSRILRSHLLVV